MSKIISYEIEFRFLSLSNVPGGILSAIDLFMDQITLIDSYFADSLGLECSSRRSLKDLSGESFVFLIKKKLSLPVQCFLGPQPSLNLSEKWILSSRELLLNELIDNTREPIEYYISQSVLNAKTSQLDSFFFNPPNTQSLETIILDLDRLYSTLKDSIIFKISSIN